jgi:hypothetical protein
MYYPPVGDRCARPFGGAGDRSSQTRGDHLRFVAYHVHPFVLAVAFPAFTVVDATVIYGFLVGSAVTVLAVPDRLRRSVAMGLFSVGLLVSLYLVTPPHGLEWFVPFLYLKLIPRTSGGRIANTATDDRGAEREGRITDPAVSWYSRS